MSEIYKMRSKIFTAFAKHTEGCPGSKTTLPSLSAVELSLNSLYEAVSSILQVFKLKSGIELNKIKY